MVLIKITNHITVLIGYLNSHIMTTIIYKGERVVKQYKVIFDENGGEYEGWLIVTCNTSEKDNDNNRIFYADGIKIEIDEKILSIVKVK
jgi:hypothetical protein